MKPETVKIAALLREARLRAGLSQEALAELTGKTRPQIARWEAGTVAPSVEALIELVQACGFDLPLDLVPLAPPAPDRLAELQQLSPEQRLDRILGQLSGQREG